MALNPQRTLTQEEMTMIWDLLYNTCQTLDMLPLDELIRAHERAEVIAPVLDPTLYRNYIYDPLQKGDKLKEIVRAAIAFRDVFRKQRDQAEELANKKK